MTLHLEIGKGGQQYGVPVHEALAPVHEPFFEQPDEHLDDSARQARIHREAIAAPVDRLAEPAHLRSDGPAGLLFPLPDPFDECFAAEVGPLQALGVELALHNHLRCDAGVVGARLP